MTRNLHNNEVVPQCYSDLNSIIFTTNTTNTKSDPTGLISQLDSQCPQNYGEGFFLNYTINKWENWRKSFEHQTGTVLKLCTGSDVYKDANFGVVQKEGQVLPYTVSWRQQYSCFRRGLPRYKRNENKKPRNAPKSRLCGCRAILTAKLIKTEYEEILHVTFPLPSSHSGHSLKSLSDMHSYQPLPEVMERVESFVSNSYLSQISLKLALQEWVTKELIPLHIQKGKLDSILSEFDRHYHPTTQDLRNITRNAINKLRRHTFDQDALGILLEDETKQHTEFQYFLRKYKT